MDNFFKIPKLKGSSNYDIWAIRLEALLTKEGFTEVINININNYTEVERNNLAQKALQCSSYILLTLEDGPLLQVRYIKNPYLLWQNLKNLYEAKGFSSEFLLSKELINVNLYTYKGNLEQYLNHFKKLVNNLEAKEITLPNKFLIALLLNNLSKEYDYLVTIITQNIRSDSSSLILEDIISNLLVEYRRISNNKNTKNIYISNNRLSYSYKYTKSNIFKDRDGDIQMALNTKKAKSKSNIRSKICSHCHKNGHLVESCFILYPHLKNIKSAKNTSINTSINTTAAEITNNNKVILATNIINKSKLNSNFEFILDSGATIHTCYIKELFIDIKPTNTYIKWGNTNKNILASGEGSIVFKFLNTNKIITLTKVLFVPELGVNLLSLSLITNKGYNISFNKTNCFIKNKDNLVIASGSYKNGISTFNIQSTKPVILNKTKINLNTNILEDLEDLNNV